jgi:hypothetical protein
MEYIDNLMVDKLIDGYNTSAREIGWLLYNRRQPMKIDELNGLGNMIIRALDEEYKSGEESAMEGIEHLL